MNTDLQGLSPQVVQEYLRSRHWQLSNDFADQHPLVEYKQDDEVVYIPVESNLADYTRRLREAIEDISKFEQRDSAKIVEDILRPPGDRVVVRVESDETTRHSLPLGKSIQLRDGVKMMLLAAAHSAISREKYFPRLSQKQAMDLFDQILELPAEGGSFATSYVIPVKPKVGELDLDDPFGRQTSVILLEALNRIHQVRRLGGLDELAEANDVGVTGNLLVALSKIRDVARTVEISMNWARSRPAPRMGALIRFEKDQLNDIESVAEILKDRSEYPGIELRGHVYLLQREDGKEAGRVVLVPEQTPDLSMRLSRLELFLKGPDYERALEAHKHGYRLDVTGVLKKEQRAWHLAEPRILRTVNLSDET